MSDREKLREKLIELIAMTTVEQVFCTSSGEVVSRYWCRAVADEGIAKIADHLIAHGVTVQKHGRWESLISIFMDTLAIVALNVGLRHRIKIKTTAPTAALI